MYIPRIDRGCSPILDAPARTVSHQIAGPVQAEP